MSEDRNTYSNGPLHGSTDGTGEPGEGKGVPPRPQNPPQTSSLPASGPAPAAGHQPPTGGNYAPGASFGPAPRRQPKRFGSTTLVTGMVIAALIGGGSAVGANYLLDGSGQSVASSTPNGNAMVINNPEKVTAVTAAAAKASPSVVTVEVDGQQEAGSGSGIILDTEGHILTNTHVVTLGGQVANPTISVRTSDGQVHTAKVVGTDPLSDLAVIKIDAKGLQPATLGSSADLNVGDAAIAIGAPLGLSGTVTDGIISTLNRTISVASSAVPENKTSDSAPDDGNQFNFQFPGQPQQQQQQSQGNGSIYINVIQTDAAINHGNSGGALVNAAGEIVGVNVAIASAGSTSSDDSGSIGVGFAIPIDYAKRIAHDIIDNGSATHGLLGVSVAAKPAESGTQFTVGAEVRDVVSGSAADKGGLKSGDVITKVDNRVISDSQSLTAAVMEHPAGSKASISYTRDGKAATVDVTLGSKPAD